MADVEAPGVLATRVARQRELFGRLDALGDDAQPLRVADVDEGRQMIENAMPEILVSQEVTLRGGLQPVGCHSIPADHAVPVHCGVVF